MMDFSKRNGIQYKKLKVLDDNDFFAPIETERGKLRKSLEESKKTKRD